MARPRNKPVEQVEHMEATIAVQRGPLGHKLHTEQVQVLPQYKRYTSVRVTVTTDAGPVELTVWPDGKATLGSRKAKAGTYAGRKIYNLWAGDTAEARRA